MKNVFIYASGKGQHQNELPEHTTSTTRIRIILCSQCCTRLGADIVLANIVRPHIHPGQTTPLVVDADMDWGISS